MAEPSAAARCVSGAGPIGASYWPLTIVPPPLSLLPNSSLDAALASAPPLSPVVVPWRIRTKYYVADVEFHLLPASDFFAPSDSAVEGAEAVLLVLDASGSAADADAALAAATAAWLPLLESVDPAVRLLCLNKCDVVLGAAPGEGGDEADAGLSDAAAQPAPPASFAGIVARLQEWCLDNGFEQVQTAGTSPFSGAGSRDKVGVPRVLEALQTTLWSTLERTTTAAAPARGGGEGDSSAVAAAAGPASGAPPAERIGGGLTVTGIAARAAAVAASSEESGAASASEASASASASAVVGADALLAAMRRDAARRADGLGGQGDAPDGEDEADAIALALGAGAAVGEAGEAGGVVADAAVAEAEKESVDVDRLFAEMLKVRDRAKDAGVRDEDRREAAAAMVAKLYALMGGGDEDEDEDEGDGEAEDGGR